MRELRLETACGLAVAAVILHAFDARAEEKIYKYRDSAGGVLYTQEASGPGELVDVLTVPSTPPADSRRRARRELAEDMAKAEVLGAQRQADEMAQRQVEQAARALLAAETALQQGLEPLPGERIGSAEGGTRLTDAYWARVRALRLSVDIARERLARASYVAAATP